MQLSNTIIGVGLQWGFSPARTTNPAQRIWASETSRMVGLQGKILHLIACTHKHFSNKNCLIS